ncbi:MAG: membrane protein insertion efficiency factor YidD [Bacteroidota bacterium]|nr:membrane protein insertion efficiency factor YidD [Bacteroidota bacterium]
MANRKLVFIFLMFFLSAKLYGQDTRKMAMVNDKLQKEKLAKVKYASAKKNKNPVQLVFSGLFLSYKYLISTQDGNKCNFYPTCSEYGMMSVKKHFFVLGLLDTFDRLTRCNGNHDAYEYDEENDCYIDLP